MLAKSPVRHMLFAVLALLVCTSIQSTAYSQSRSAVIGRVFDQTQALLPGVTVDLILEETRTTLTTVTSGDGTYRFDNVPSSRAEITFRLINFSTVRRTLEIPAVIATTVDVTLLVSSTADITVTAPFTFRNLADLDQPAENIVGVAAASSEGAITAAQLEARPQ